MAAQEVCCANCDCTKTIMKRCAGCMHAFYCSQDCQRNHWPSHQAECARKHCNIKVDNVNKIVTHINHPASTESCASIVTEKTERQHMNNTLTFHSHCNEEKMLAARNEGISCNTDELGKLSSPKSDVRDLKQGKCLLAAQELELTDGFCKDITTEPTRSSSCSEDGNINAQEATTIIFIKHNKIKHTVGIPSLCTNGKLVLQHIADLLHIPVPKLKLIHKGKMVTQENIECFISEKALFQAFGEVAETEDDLEKSDIDLIMKQVDVERNTAIRALRKAETVIDAIIDLGNK